LATGKPARLPDLFRIPASDPQLTVTAIDPSDRRGLKVSKKFAPRELAKIEQELAGLQERLWAEQKRSVLVVLQGMDTSGKDGTVKHVMRGVNPEGVRVYSFKEPTPEELRHDFLWRVRKQLPRPGEIGIFNRSHYEDVLIARVDHLAPAETIERRYATINRFEAELVRSRVTLMKVMLHISFEEQRVRLIARLEDQTKHWKFSAADIDKRLQWDDYMGAYDLVLRRCSPAGAPWYVVPADSKWFRNYVVSLLLLETLRRMNPRYPRPRLNVAGLMAKLEAQAGG
jgi:PPK2 family polyphosphate:nucleotide phosphotransferase